MALKQWRYQIRWKTQIIRNRHFMALRFSNISHRYGANRVLDNVSLEAKCGEITCLLGPSGCGKTTLLRLAAGLLPLQQGEISLHGEVLQQKGLQTPPEALPVGLVFQDGALFPHLRVSANIGFGLGRQTADRQRIDALIEQIDLRGLGGRYPHQLSGGQQQRVALARALAPSPEVLLLDEPFANIDVTLRRRLREEMRMILKESGTAVLLVTHDPEEALEMASRVAVLDEGQIVQFDTPEALYDTPATPDIAQALFGAQVIEGVITESTIATAFGEWPREALMSHDDLWGPVSLVVYADRFKRADEAAALTIKDRRVPGPKQRLVLAGAGGEELVVELDRSQRTDSETITIAPTASSIRAFCLSA
jgi:iron(III) transport system ATP-binding protein